MDNNNNTEGEFSGWFMDWLANDNAGSVGAGDSNNSTQAQSGLTALPPQDIDDVADDDVQFVGSRYIDSPEPARPSLTALRPQGHVSFNEPRSTMGASHRAAGRPSTTVQQSGARGYLHDGVSRAVERYVCPLGILR